MSSVSLKFQLFKMDAIIKYVALLVLLADLAILVPLENVNDTNNLVPGVPESNSTQRNCTTGKGEVGSCVLRRYCDFGTQFVDLTLYAPNNYIRPCHDKEACCPFNSLLPMPDENPVEDASFEFNEND